MSLRRRALTELTLPWLRTFVPACAVEAVIASIRQKHGVTEKMMTEAMVANQQDPIVQVRGAACADACLSAASLAQHQLATSG